MKNLYLFNPDSDLALGNNDENYMAPEPARKIGSDLALLPIWYADPESLVLTTSHPHAAYFSKLSELFTFPTELITYPQVKELGMCKAQPWGWNLAVRKQFLELGVPEQGVRSKDAVSRMRDLSHREISSQVLDLFPKLPIICGKSRVLSSRADLDDWSRENARFLLKAPLSGSGKGLKWCREGLDKAAIKWFDNTLSKQGSVMAEPIYAKIQDVAMEYEVISSNEIHFIGYSSFSTNANGAYTGNYLLSDSLFESQLERDYFHVGFLKEVRAALEPLLLQFYGADYQGKLGVDMMVCQEEENASFLLHPCVEVNLRMNMGIVAHSIYKRYVQEDRKGIYQVDYARKQALVYQHHLELIKKHPLRVEEGRIASGYLALCPVTPESQYHAWILIE